MGSIKKFFVCLWLLIVALSVQGWTDFKNETSSDIEFHETSRVLSRRKRFLVFDEGSSVQLVFCVTFPTVFTIGDIFLWGYTAAFAYELPQDPYSPFEHHADPLHRRMDKKTIYYTNEDGIIISKKPYKKKFIVNPAFAKRSVDSAGSVQTDEIKKGTPDEFKKGTANEFKIDRKQMHASTHRRKFLKSEHMDSRTVEFHRSSRALLYEKIETMVTGLGGHGRQCMLKTLCLVGQTQARPQATFLQEILRAVFTLPKKLTEDRLKEYDEAYSTSESCDILYPKCNKALSDPSSPTFSY